MIGLPGVPGDGMPGKNAQWKLGTTRGSPRRSRTAKASRISRYAAKSRCAREWGGWGRLSGDGSGHDNPNRSEGPWGMWRHLMAARNRAGSVRGVVGIISGIISENLVIAYYAARSNC